LPAWVLGTELLCEVGSLANFILTEMYSFVYKLIIYFMIKNNLGVVYECCHTSLTPPLPIIMLFPHDVIYGQTLCSNFYYLSCNESHENCKQEVFYYFYSFLYVLNFRPIKHLIITTSPVQECMEHRKHMEQPFSAGTS
jgi:hypothetical protein